MLSDINLATLKHISPLLPGPRLFQQQNLLTAVQTNPHVETQDQHACQMLIGRRGSYTHPHTDWYGCDGYLHLLEGEKIWYLAPPQHHEPFYRIFEGKNVNVTSHTADVHRELGEAQCHVVVQRAGDTIFVPGNWLHCVKNLSDTVAIGGSYLRAWKLPFLISWLRSTSLEIADLQFNWRGIIEFVERTELVEFGITEAERREFVALHQANKKLYGKELTSAHVIALRNIWFVYTAL